MERICKLSALPLNHFVGCASMTRAFTPSRAIHRAAVSLCPKAQQRGGTRDGSYTCPDGPAPMINTSVVDSVAEAMILVCYLKILRAIGLMSHVFVQLIS